MPGTGLFDLTGRVALVTGGSKGLGKAIARGFMAAGGDVAIASRSEDELDATLAEISEGSGGRCMRAVADLSLREDAERLAGRVLEEMGRVDILVNNAGSNVPEGCDEINDANWDRIMELNLNSAMVLTRALVPQMKTQRWGRVIHVSSVLGLGGKAGRNVYCTTKAGLIGLARSACLDLGEHGITVNCIAPGPFLTDLPKNILSAEQKQDFCDRTALRRWGDPSEIVGAALLLASDAGSYITGSTLVVDGGVMAHTL